jgi:hypothetical protein
VEKGKRKRVEKGRKKGEEEGGGRRRERALPRGTIKEETRASTKGRGFVEEGIACWPLDGLWKKRKEGWRRRGRRRRRQEEEGGEGEEEGGGRRRRKKGEGEGGRGPYPGGP